MVSHRFAQFLVSSPLSPLPSSLGHWVLSELAEPRSTSVELSRYPYQHLFNLIGTERGIKGSSVFLGWGGMGKGGVGAVSSGADFFSMGILTSSTLP